MRLQHSFLVIFIFLATLSLHAAVAQLPTPTPESCL